MKRLIKGLVRGVVVQNNDPKGIGRVQVRVYAIHGTSNDVPDELLPWAFPCFTFAGYNCGSYIIPEINSVVFLLFEDDDIEKPVYIGQMYGIGTTKPKVLKHNKRNRTQRANDIETPKEVKSVDNIILAKSRKGSAVIIDDTDNIEAVYIKDPLGAYIKFDCGMTSTMSQNNSHLDDKLIDDKDFNGYATMSKQSHSITLKSLSKSFISLISKLTSSIIHLCVPSKVGVAEIKVVDEGKSSILLNAENGIKATVSISDKVKISVGEASYVEIDSVSVKAQTVKADVQATSVKVNATDVSIVATKIDLTAPMITMNGYVECKGNMLTMGNNVTLGISTPSHVHHVP